MWFLTVSWPDPGIKDSELRAARRYLLPTSSTFRFSRNSKGTGSDAPNFLIPHKAISSKAGTLTVGDFDPSSNPNDPGTIPPIEFECRKEGTIIARSGKQPDGEKWKETNEELLAELEDANAENFFINVNEVKPDDAVGMKVGDKTLLESGDVIYFSPKSVGILEWVSLAFLYCSKETSVSALESTDDLPKDVLKTAGIYLKIQKNGVPNGYTHFVSEAVTLAHSNLEACIKGCAFVKPKFLKQLLEQTNELLETNKELIRDEKEVGISMNYQSFKFPDFKSNHELGHHNDQELEKTLELDTKNAVIAGKVRDKILVGATFMFFLALGCSSKTEKSARNFASIIEQLGGVVHIREETTPIAGSAEAKKILQPIQKEAFNNFQQHRKKSRLQIGSESDSLILITVLPALVKERTEDSNNTWVFLIDAINQLGAHDLGHSPWKPLYRSIATEDLSLLRIRTPATGADAEALPEAGPSGARSGVEATADQPQRTAETEKVASDGPTQDVPMNDATAPQKAAPAPTPLRRRARTNKVDSGLDAIPSSGTEGGPRAQAPTASSEAPLSSRSAPLKRRNRTGQDATVTSLFAGVSSKEQSAAGTSMKGGASQPESTAQRLLREQEEREKLEATGESIESEMVETNVENSASRNKAKTRHENEKALQTVGEDKEMQVDSGVPNTSTSRRNEKSGNGKNKRRAEDEFEADEEEEERQEPSAAGKQASSRKRRENEVNNPSHPSNTGLTIEALPSRGAQDGQQYQDKGFVEALKTRAKTARSLDKDNLDRDFNKLKLSKGKLDEANKVEKDEAYEEWRKMSDAEFAELPSINGNYIQVDVIPLVVNNREGTRFDGSKYVDGRLKGEVKPEWNNRMNYKKFKKPKSEERAPPVQMSLSEVHDYGLGPGYGSRPRPKAAAKNDEMDQDGLDEENGAALENSDQEDDKLAPTNRNTSRTKSSGKITQSSTAAKGKGVVQLDWSEESGSDQDLDESLGSATASRSKGKGKAKAGKPQTVAQKKKAAADAKKAKSKPSGIGKGKGKKKVIDSGEDELDDSISESDQDEPDMDLDLDLSDEEEDDFSFAKPKKRTTRKSPVATSKAKASTSRIASGSNSRRTSKPPAPTGRNSGSSTLKASFEMDLDDEGDSQASGRRVGKRKVDRIIIDDDEDSDDDGNFGGFDNKTSKRRR